MDEKNFAFSFLMWKHPVSSLKFSQLGVFMY